MEYSSANAMFPDLGGAQGSRHVSSASAKRPAAPRTYLVDGGTMQYDTADNILDGDAHVVVPAGGFDAKTVKVDDSGWQCEGPGREEGSGLRLRESLADVLVVMIATSAYHSLKGNFDSSEPTFQALAGLKVLRRKHAQITYAGMRGRVYDLAPSGAIGVVVRFAGQGSRDSDGNHQVVVITVSLVEDRLVCACSAEERCLAVNGCSFRSIMVAAVEKVRSAMGVPVSDLFMVLGAALKTRHLRAGLGVLYGDKTCVVRNGNTSWPFSAVRRTRGGSWVCLSCRTGDATCDHATSAVSAFKLKAEGPGDSSDSEGDEDDGEEARLLALSDLSAAADQEMAGATELPPHLPGATGPLSPVNRFKWSPRSADARHLVPPLIAQQERAALMRALRDPTHKVIYPAGAQCPFCLSSRGTETRIENKKGKVEFEDGVVPATVETWRCSQCLFRVLPDGKARGVVFHSCYTVFSEAFLFEVAVNLARNGSSLHSASYLRSAFQELHVGSKYPRTTERMRSVKVLRKGLLLYLALVIKGLPYATVSCETCRRPDGSYTIVSFDGLQLGYRVKFKVPFNRSDVKTHAVARASRVPCLVTDEAVSKALGRVLSAKRDGNATASTKAITTLTAMRGHIIAVALLLGSVLVDGVPQTFAGETPHMEGGVTDRGWDPEVDGGASPELVAFLRGIFNVRLAARSLALTVESAAADLRRRVPVPLLERVHALVCEVDEAGGDTPRGAADEDGEDMAVHGADYRDANDKNGHDKTRGDADGTDGGTSSSSDDDVFSSDDDDGVEMPRHAKKRTKVIWERDAPLLAYGEALEEPALATTGGGNGADRLKNLSLPLLDHIPGTAASALKIMEFARAIVVDPVVVWAPQGSWSAVDAVIEVLRSDNFDIASLAAVLRLPAVTEQRLLRGVVACLGPSMDADPAVRHLLADVLAGLKRRMAEYNKWVGDADDADTLRQDEVDALREEMAAAHPLHTFSHKQYSDAWLRPPASVSAYRSVYSEYADQTDDYLKTGMWSPGLPVLRPMPGFSGAATANTDLPTCNHDMGKENSHTGGTVGAFCTCAHPKCIGVMVLTGSESQLMPLEFVAQRFVQLPDVVVYDFACATLKSALVRLCELARKLALKCDRFHWRENHTDCSCAMCPDSYVSMDAVNTSSCEERNALSRRQQHHLRQMKQDQFITFTVYQQALSNAVAMHRDKKTLGSSTKWPEWYRQTHVDVVDPK